MKDFFKMLFASIIGVIIGLVIVTVIGFVIFAGMAASMGSSSAYKLQKNTVLRLNLNENLSITEQENPDPFDVIFNRSGESYGLNDILSAIRKAEKNDNIKGIYLNVGGSFSILGYVSKDFTTMEPIRNALLEFKKSGKFIIAYGENFSQPTYYLSSIADTIFMNPLGTLDFRGIATSIQFNKGVFEKWGLEWQVYKVGTYKSFVEPYIQDKMSDANREQVTAYLNDVWGTVLNKISESRGISVEQLNQYADEFIGFLDPGKIVEYKLIDELKYADEAETYLKNLLGLEESAKLRFAGVKNMLSVQESGKKVSKDKIAVLYAEGSIMGDYGDSFFPSGITAKKYVKELNKLKDDKNVKAVVFRVNSPGGDAYASEQIWHAVKELKAVKPVVVSMGTYAASGGYYISCSANKIISEPTTLTGSIGIFAVLPNGAQLTKKMGATHDGVSTNKMSDFGGGRLSIPLFFDGINLFLPTRPFTNEESAKLQMYIERGYDLFLSRCAEGRGKTKEEIDAIGQGRVWTGRQALNLGLVDALGGIDVAIKAAAELAEIENYSINEYPAKKDLFLSILESSSESLTERVWMGIIGKESFQQKQMLKAWQNYDFRQAVMPEFINQ